MTICYPPLTAPLSERRAILQKHFGFFCEARQSRNVPSADPPLAQPLTLPPA